MSNINYSVEMTDCPCNLFVLTNNISNMKTKLTKSYQSKFS